MRAALCQLNPTVGAVDQNARLVATALESAAAGGAQIAVLPELVVPGYPPLDLLERGTFVDACTAAEERIVGAIPEGLTAVFGNVSRASGPLGRPLTNAAVVARRGEVLTRVAKSLLPTYDVFDEARYFEPRSSSEEPRPAWVDVDGLRLGITVCEDIWNDEVLWSVEDLPRDASPGATRLYSFDPVSNLVARGAEVIVNLSASPWSRGKVSVRERIVTHLARRHGVTCLYCNAVGGNDGLIFDGHALAAASTGELIARGPGWRSATLFVDLKSPHAVVETIGNDTEETREALCLGIRDYFQKSGIQRAVVGLSGGIDSAVTCALAVRALGPNRVMGVGMPSEVSSKHSVEDAEALARNLGIEFHLVPIATAVDAFEIMLAPAFAGRARGVTEENIQSRVRGTTLMAIANKFGAVVLGTGNKSEASMGYATLYGDTIGAISVLADLYKHQVYDMARLLNEDGEVIPQRTIDKPPSAELRPNQKDTDSLPDYAVLDAILKRFIEDRESIEQITDEVGAEPGLVRDIIAKVYANEFKRKQLPPTLRVCRKAWVGRVYPIVQRFRE